MPTRMPRRLRQPTDATSVEEIEGRLPALLSSPRTNDELSADEQHRLLLEWAERGPQGPLDAEVHSPM